MRSIAYDTRGNMKLTSTQLRQIIKEELARALKEDESDLGKDNIVTKESTAYRKGMLLEGHNRITPEEMNAWMSGDWGFVSEDASSKLYNSQTAWVDAVRDDDRTIGELLDAHDDMTKTPLRGYDVTVSSSAFHDLLPHADLKISELQDATVIERVDALIKDLKSLADAIDNDR